MGRFGQAVWTGFGSALGLGLGLAVSRWATSSMEDGEKRSNIVLAGAVGGAAVGGATAAAITAPKQLGA